MPDADVEPEPCRDCMTPIPPGYGWCQECDQKRKRTVTVDEVVGIFDGPDSVEWLREQRG